MVKTMFILKEEGVRVRLIFYEKADNYNINSFNPNDISWLRKFDRNPAS